MKQNTNDRRAHRGYAIMAALLLAALAIFNIDIIADHFHGYVDVVAIVPQTRGVRVGSPVLVEGIESGRVTALDFVAGAGPSVAVHLRLDEEVLSVVRRGTLASTARRRLIGQPMVVLAAGPPTAPPVSSGDTLQALDRPSLTSLLEQGSRFPAALDSLGGAVRQLEHLLDRRRPGFEAMADGMAAVSAEAGVLREDLDRGSLGRLIEDPTLTGRLRRVREQAGGLAEGTRRLERYAGGDSELGRGIRDLAARAERLDTALDRLTAGIEAGDGMLGRMRSDSALIVAIGGLQAQIDSLRAEGMGFALRMVLP